MNEYASRIKEWIERRKQKNETNIVQFCISPAKANASIYEDKLINKIAEKFKAIGIETRPVDTVDGSFNLNRDFLETDEMEAIIEYCGVYPVNMNPEDSAWLSKLDDEGKIRIVVFVKRGDVFVPNF